LKFVRIFERLDAHIARQSKSHQMEVLIVCNDGPCRLRHVNSGVFRLNLSDLGVPSAAVDIDKISIDPRSPDWSTEFDWPQKEEMAVAQQ
jgi:hypothetical protein